jgi:hypothetical protein
MSREAYTFNGLGVLVERQACDRDLGLDHVLDGLLWVKADAVRVRPCLRLRIRLTDDELKVPSDARQIFRLEGFRGVELENVFYLTDGRSALLMPGGSNEGFACICPSFFEKESSEKTTFWTFAILKLLRAVEHYGLHAAGLATKDGSGLLIVGSSGSGKSTLTVGMISRGWNVLSDDALLLRSRDGGVSALALRNYLCVDGEVAQVAGLILGAEVNDSDGRRRRKISIPAKYAGRQVAECLRIRTVLFPRIVPDAKSILAPLSATNALRHLLVASGTHLFDAGSMPKHLEVLKTLIQHARTYELRAGRDLRSDPTILTRLLEQKGLTDGSDGHRADQPVQSAVPALL